MNIVKQLGMNVEELPNHKEVKKFLDTFRKKIDVVIIATEEFKDLLQLYVDELLGSLLSHEFIINRNDDYLEN